jgi:hypothetical protein
LYNDIYEAIPQEQGIELPEGGIELLEEENPIKFTRKQTPIFSGVLNYFPDAIREVAKCSYAGQQQHNPDKPLAWDRSKSGDELDALTRHLLELYYVTHLIELIVNAIRTYP